MFCVASNNCEPLIASLLVALTSPLATLWIAVPFEPSSVTESFVVPSYATNAFVTAPVESTIAPASVNFLTFTASISTVPAATLWICVPSVPFSVTESLVVPSYATNAFVTAPVESTIAPASVNCLTFTASISTLSAATLWICVPSVPFRVTESFVVPSYATNAFVTAPVESTIAPASVNCLTFTASLSSVPAATLWICVPSVPFRVTESLVVPSYATNAFVTAPVESTIAPASVNCFTFTAS